jgi:hypothetical protein
VLEPRRSGMISGIGCQGGRRRRYRCRRGEAKYRSLLMSTPKIQGLVSLCRLQEARERCRLLVGVWRQKNVSGVVGVHAVRHL